jgi:hypothetical protein
MHRPQTAITSPGSYYALGWRVEKLGSTPIIRHGGEVSNFMGEMVLLPEQNLGVVVLTNVGNGLLPVGVPDVSRMASDVTRFLLGIPAPRRRLSFWGFYVLLNTALSVLSVYHVWSLTRLLQPRRHRHPALGIASLVEVALGIMALRRIPHLADSPWKLLRIYVPDVTTWLAAFFAVSILKCLCFLFRSGRRL